MDYATSCHQARSQAGTKGGRPPALVTLLCHLSMKLQPVPPSLCRAFKNLHKLQWARVLCSSSNCWCPSNSEVLATSLLVIVYVYDCTCVNDDVYMYVFDDIGRFVLIPQVKRIPRLKNLESQMIEFEISSILNSSIQKLLRFLCQL